MFKIIAAAASGVDQSQSSRLISDPEAIDLTDTPTKGVAQGQTGLNPQGHLTGSAQSLEFDGIDDYIKLATANGFGTEILTEDMGETDIKHGSTANNVAMETWLKLDSSSTAIDKNSEFFEMTIQRNSTSSTTGLMVFMFAELFMHPVLLIRMLVHAKPMATVMFYPPIF